MTDKEAVVKKSKYMLENYQNSPVLIGGEQYYPIDILWHPTVENPKKYDVYVQLKTQIIPFKETERVIEDYLTLLRDTELNPNP